MATKLEISSSGRVMLKHKNKMPKPDKVSVEPAKSKNSSAASSLCLHNDAMKIQSINKLFKPKHNKMFSGSTGGCSYNKNDLTKHQDVTNHGKTITKEEVTLNQDSSNDDDIMRKYKSFKKFDIAQDYADHHYSKSKSAKWMPHGDWVKRIQKEWRSLKKHLPDMIYVRVYESRMDLLRAVIVGAEGTPYHDGLFFFDVCFPKDYPQYPPQVHYHSGGLRINPNLYNSGKVCLSLLNTWSGAKNEHWIPGVSTMLQVLVSIQGLILNAKPYFNEPGYERLRTQVYGEYRSLLYNERTLILSLKTMVYTMKKPPKNFEDLVIGHFRERGLGILTTSKAYYTKGIRVGCGVDEGEETCSKWFKNDVKGYMKILVGAFKKIGVKDVDEFVPPTLNLTKKIKACFGI